MRTILLSVLSLAEIANAQLVTNARRETVTGQWVPISPTAISETLR